mgnify:CR=1 FL=1
MYKRQYGPVPLSEVDKVKLKQTEIGEIPEDWNVVKLGAVSYTHLRAHETPEHTVCRHLLEKKKYIILSLTLNIIVTRNETPSLETTVTQQVRIILYLI